MLYETNSVSARHHRSGSLKSVTSMASMHVEGPDVPQLSFPDVSTASPTQPKASGLPTGFSVQVSLGSALFAAGLAAATTAALFLTRKK